MGKLKSAVSVAIVLCDMQMQLTSILLNSKGYGHSDFYQGYFFFQKRVLGFKIPLSETNGPDC